MSVNWPAIGATILPNLGGFASGLCVRKNLPWYETLQRPAWRPPNWAFGPVWTGLYSGMGYASYLVYRDGGGFSGDAKLALLLYGGNLALNWAWTPIFFQKHNLKLAFYEINLLNITALGTGVLFWKINRNAGYLFIPYVLWLGLATALTYKIYKNNPEQTGNESETSNKKL